MLMFQVVNTVISLSFKWILLGEENLQIAWSVSYVPCNAYTHLDLMFYSFTILYLSRHEKIIICSKNLHICFPVK